jgi:uncharacterized membrane protein required for colicin V production
MNIIDAVIILLLLLGAVKGFTRGFTRQLFSFLGFIGVVVLAFYFKNYVSVFMYENLPFFPFGGMLKGVTVLNIAVYEIIAFFLVLAVLMLILRLILFASGIFETLLNMTIILGIPSKIMGAVLGVLEVYVIIFIALYFLSMPNFNIEIIKESYANDKILSETPVLSGYIDKTMKVFDEFAELKEKYKNATDVNQFNYETLDLFLKYEVITTESVRTLDEKNKIQIDNIDVLLAKYEEV